MYSEIGRELLKWFEINGRDFFWRTHSDPYTVLIAEILLKKTSAGVVDRFLPVFLEHYPDIRTLRDGSISNLQKLLAPLGLSKQRTLQLNSLALVLVESHEGIIPCSKEELLKLPGIGDYTAGAVLSFAYNKSVPIVDTNVARVITRVYELKPSRYEARRSPEVWEKANGLVSVQPEQATRINWALLDLGALICKSRRPKCAECPLRNNCAFVTLKNSA